MINIKLGHLYKLYRLRDCNWDYTDFAKAQINEEYLGYGAVEADPFTDFIVVKVNGDTIYEQELNEAVGIRPTLDYLYVKDFVEDKKEIRKGIYEVTFGEYPKTRIISKVDANTLTETGRKYSVRKSYYTVPLKELVDQNGTRMVCYEDNYYKVEKLTWLVDEENDIMITKDVINGGFAYERELDDKEEFYLRQGTRPKTKYSLRMATLDDIRRNETQLVEAFLRCLLSEEIISEELKKKIEDRDVRKAAELEAKRKAEEEINRVRNENRQFMDYAFPNNANTAIKQVEFSQEDKERISQIIAEELDNLKYYIEDKDTLIEIIVEIYKLRESFARKAGFPESRYDTCREYLSTFSVEHLNVILDRAISKKHIPEFIIRDVCKEKNTQYRKKYKD